MSDVMLELMHINQSYMRHIIYPIWAISNLFHWRIRRPASLNILGGSFASGIDKFFQLFKKRPM